MRKFEHNYAGFDYVITEDDQGRLSAEALPGQHFASKKPRHIMAAIEDFREQLERDQKRKKS